MTDGIDLAERPATKNKETLVEPAMWSTTWGKTQGIDEFRDTFKEIKTLKRGRKYGAERVWRYIAKESEGVTRRGEVTLSLILSHDFLAAHKDWDAIRSMLKYFGREIEREEIVEGFRSNMKAVLEALGRLAVDFNNIDRRLIRCAGLEKALGNFERCLQKTEKAKYLRWTIANLRAALNFNYPEDLTNSKLGLMQDAIDMIERKGLNVNRGVCRDIRRRLINSGLSLLPTSKRAVAEFGGDE